jgi:hypothetical protein
MFAPIDSSGPNYTRRTGPELVASAEAAYRQGKQLEAEYILALAYEAYDYAYGGGPAGQDV